ncbi:MAG: autotransporter domain-containing protein [Bradyrhizobium sp.]|nr:autotransporter domain-containing protein [Bradyrhizobium sp.]
MTKIIAGTTPAARRSLRLASLLLSSTAMISLAVVSAAEADETWTGATTNSWLLTGNWSGAAVPTGTDDVFIDTMAIHPTVLQGAGTANDVSVGINGTGSLRVMGTGSTLGVHSIELGLNAGSTGTLTVESGATVTSTTGLTIGTDGTGIVVVQTGGTVTANEIILGEQASASGTVTVDGTGSRLTSSTDLVVGLLGLGHLTVSNGAQVTSANGYIGYAPGFASDVTVTGIGSTWTSIGVFVGGNNTGSGTGSLTISNGGTVDATSGLAVGAYVGSIGSLTIQGSNSTLNDGGTLVLGSGTISVSNGGKVSATDVILAFNAGYTGTLTVDGANSTITASNDFYVGYASTGTATITNGAVVTAADMSVAMLAGSTGTLTVDGTNSTASAGGYFDVGYAGNGTMAVQNGGSVNAAGIIFGNQAGATGTVTVDGVGSTLTSTADLIVGAFGTGSLTVSNGGSVVNVNGYIGYEPGSIGTALVTGTGSTWTNSGEMIIGGSATTAGTGSLTVAAGGTVNTDGLLIASLPSSVGTVTVQGANSTLASSDTLTVGYGGVGTMLISNGGTVISTAGAIGGFTSGTATVDGVGSKWTDTGDLIIGSHGAGTLTLSNGGATSVAGIVYLAQAAGSVGTLNIGAAPGSTAVGAGTLTAATIQLGSGTGTINFNHTDTAYVFSPAIIGPGTINQISGVTDMTGDSSLFTGATNITGGRLAVNGSLTNSVVTVASGGILGGNGTVGGIFALAGGIVGPGNSIGTLNVAGNVMFLSGSIYQVEANAAGQADKIVATGTATLGGGTVQVLAASGSYAPSTPYTILTASMGIGGTFADVSSNLAFLTPTLTYDPENVYLTLTRNAVAFQNVGFTHNQIVTGSGIQSLATNNAVFEAILPLDAATARGAFDQLSGEIHASVKTGIIEDSRFVRDAAINRLRAAFDSVSGAPGPPPSATGENTALAVDGLAFWTQGFGSWGTTDGNGNAAKLDRTTSGFLVGADALTFADLRVGLLGGYSHSSVDANARSSVGSIDNFHFGVYGGAQWGPLGLRTGATYSWHHITTTRAVAFTGFSDRLTSTYDAGTAQVFGDIGYRIDAGPITFEPFANLAYVNLATNGFNEHGTVAALTGRSDTVNVAYSTTGLRSTAAFNLGTLSATMRGTLAWRHASGDLTPTTVLSFAGGADFSIDGAPIARDAAVIDAGLDVAVLRDLHMGLTYAGQIAAHAQDHSFKATLNWKF